MPWLLTIAALTWLSGVVFSYASHRTAKIALPMIASCGLSAASIAFLIFLYWNFVTLMPSAQFARFGCILLGVWFFLSAAHLWLYRRGFTKFSQLSPSAYPWSLLSALLLCIVQIAVLAGLAFIFIKWDSRCYAQRQDIIVFTGHLKSLCVEQQGSGLCPTTEDELKAFDPERYRRLQRCARTTYSYDTPTEWFQWRVKFHNQEMFADPTHLPGVGIPPRD